MYHGYLKSRVVFFVLGENQNEMEILRLEFIEKMGQVIGIENCSINSYSYLRIPKVGIEELIKLLNQTI